MHDTVCVAVTVSAATVLLYFALCTVSFTSLIYLACCNDSFILLTRTQCACAHNSHQVLFRRDLPDGTSMTFPVMLRRDPFEVRRGVAEAEAGGWRKGDVSRTGSNKASAVMSQDLC